MTYVPMTGPGSGSPRVRELGQKLADVIKEYQQHYPMRATEIRAALRLAAQRSGKGLSSGTYALKIGALGLAALAGVGFFVARQNTPIDSDIWIGLVAGVVALLAGVAVAVRNR